MKIIKEEKLTERNWNTKLKAGSALRRAIAEEDYQGIIDGIRACYKEMLDKGIIDDWDYERWTEDLDMYAPDDEDIEDTLDYELGNLYDACDNLGCWIELDESLKEDNKKIDKAQKSKEKIANEYGVSSSSVVWKGGNKFVVVKDGKEICVDESLNESASSNDMLNIIYDTLMNNKKFPQFDVSKVEDSELDSNNSTITFDYNGKTYQLILSELDKSVTEDLDNLESTDNTVVINQPTGAAEEDSKKYKKRFEDATKEPEDAPLFGAKEQPKPDEVEEPKAELKESKLSLDESLFTNKRNLTEDYDSEDLVQEAVGYLEEASEILSRIEIGKYDTADLVEDMRYLAYNFDRIAEELYELHESIKEGKLATYKDEDDAKHEIHKIADNKYQNLYGVKNYGKYGDVATQGSATFSNRKDALNAIRKHRPSAVKEESLSEASTLTKGEEKTVLRELQKKLRNINMDLSDAKSTIRPYAKNNGSYTPLIDDLYDARNGLMGAIDDIDNLIFEDHQLSSSREGLKNEHLKGDKSISEASTLPKGGKDEKFDTDAWSVIYWELSDESEGSADGKMRRRAKVDAPMDSRYEHVDPVNDFDLRVYAADESGFDLAKEIADAWGVKYKIENTNGVHANKFPEEKLQMTLLIPEEMIG